MLSFREIKFENGAKIFLRPGDHDRQVNCLLGQVINKQLIINGMSVETAAAWNYAITLYHMPVEGYA